MCVCLSVHKRTHNHLRYLKYRCRARNEQSHEWEFKIFLLQKHGAVRSTSDSILTLSTNHPAEEPLLLWPMVTFLTFPKFGASMVNLSSAPFSKLFLLLSRCLSPDDTKTNDSSFIILTHARFGKLITTDSWLIHYLCRQILQRYWWTHLHLCRLILCPQCKHWLYIYYLENSY